jgi:small subunit ribosomal protein S13
MFFPFIESTIPFRKKIRKLDRLNLFQFFFQRYGIGANISKLLLKYSGFAPEVKSTRLRTSLVGERLRAFFVKNVSKLDSNLRDYMIKQIETSIRLGSYKGVRHVFKYPCRGQRTRSNARTRKRFSLQPTGKNKK